MAIIDDNGFYNLDGGDAGTADREVLCSFTSDYSFGCGFAYIAPGEEPAAGSWDSPDAKVPIAITNYMYGTQLKAAKRFQEPIPFDDWKAGQMYGTEIDLSAVDRTPVSFIHPITDTICPVHEAEEVYAKITAPNSHFRVMRSLIDFDHLTPFLGTFSAEFVERMLETIETSTVSEPSVQSLIREGLDWAKDKVTK